MTTPDNPTSAVRGRLRASGDQGVTFVERFFDLVFVFALNQITKIVVEDLTWAGAAEAVVVFWMIWWAWTQFTWALNPADTTHGAVRLVTLLATAAGFLLAVIVLDLVAAGRADGDQQWDLHQRRAPACAYRGATLGSRRRRPGALARKGF